MKWRAYGGNAILVDFAEKPDEKAFQKCRALVGALSADPPLHLVEFVPGYTTILLEFEIPAGRTLADLAADSLALLEKHALTRVLPGPAHRIPVWYDGPDLKRVAEHNGLSESQVVSLHSARVYKVYLLGFAPGFPYLGELDPKLRTPRLPSPRARVEAGSVAIGGEHTGIYPVASPGGWNIIGRTDFKVFDLSRAHPNHEEDAFALKVGDQVQFEPV